MSVSLRSYISGTGSYLPERRLTNQDLEGMVDTNNEWILERTGISERHIAAENQATSDLALKAAQSALEMANLTPQDIDAILFATVTPDQVMPNTACMLQSKLGCRPGMAIDLSAACTGFVYGLSIADSLIKTSGFKHVLVIGAEVLSRIINYKDRETCILFGDGAGAVVLSRCEASSNGSQILSTHLEANGSLGELLTLPGGGSRLPLSQYVLDNNLQFVHMKGREIFKSAIRALTDSSRKALEIAATPVDQIDWFIPHQANTRIIDAVGEQLGLPKEKTIVNIRETGNTSSASIPVALDQAVRTKKIARGDTVLIAAFGGGLTYGAAALRF